MRRPPEEIACAVIEAASTWEPTARIVANVTAAELADLAQAVLTYERREKIGKRQLDDRRREVQRLRDELRRLSTSPGVEFETSVGSLLVRAGDVLEGIEGDVTTRIEVIYVSEETLLARHLWSRRSDGVEVTGPRGESNWTLTCRDWRKVEGSTP